MHQIQVFLDSYHWIACRNGKYMIFEQAGIHVGTF